MLTLGDLIPDYDETQTTEEGPKPRGYQIVRSGGAPERNPCEPTVYCPSHYHSCCHHVGEWHYSTKNGVVLCAWRTSDTSCHS